MSEPASAKAMAIAAPMPLVPPVMTAVLPSRENILRNESDIAAGTLGLDQADVHKTVRDHFSGSRQWPLFLNILLNDVVAIQYLPR